MTERRKLPIFVEMIWTLSKLRRIAKLNYCGELKARIDAAMQEVIKVQEALKRKK